MSALLAVDIGNSTIGFGIFLNPIKNTKLFIKKIPTHPIQSAEAYKKIIAEIIEHSIHSPNHPFTHSPEIDSIISSVVPSLNPPIIKAVEDICGRQPLIVSHKLHCGLTFSVKQPGEIGADRIVNALAGFYYFKKPVAVVDFGTATTITVVGRHSNFLGGTIMPGIELMQKALHTGTAKLPPVSIKRPKTVLGKDTASSMTSGIINGTAGAVETLIKSIEKELGFRLKLVLTGGYAKLVSPLIKRKHCMAPNLTFEGLRLIYLYHVERFCKAGTATRL
ncbi:MAG: type III pantothenate kinase [Thermodesulfovibrionales bacterium]|jgi:type III pantothenate kinase|nr:type III pantothenate kinase [Thermodesulfovibrionales bacterium]